MALLHGYHDGSIGFGAHPAVGRGVVARDPADADPVHTVRLAVSPAMSPVGVASLTRL
jgi:hypothetical protein